MKIVPEFQNFEVVSTSVSLTSLRIMCQKNMTESLPKFVI